MSSKGIGSDEIAAAHALGAAAAAEFQITLAALTKEATSVDGLQILARVGFSVLLSRPGSIERADRPGLELFHLELIQALVLSRGRATVDPKADYPAVTQRIVDLIGQNAQAYRDQAKSKISADVAENRRQELLNLIQRWTLAVRGARQGFQTREYAKDLSSAINPTFRHHYGCDATEVVAVLSAVIDICQIRVEAFLQNMRGWMTKKSASAMLEAFTRDLDPVRQKEVEVRAMGLKNDPRQMQAMLWNINEERLINLFTFTKSELMASVPMEQRASVEAVLSLVSLEFGAVTVADLEHLHLDNPVQLKPLIPLTESAVFCAGPQVLGVHLAASIEGLCARIPKLKKAAERSRARWLEDRLSVTVRRYLPHADVREQVKWSDDGGATTWECDLVAVIDKTVLVFEAKSAKISAPARRGALRSLKDALKELVVAPSEQSLRMKQRILSAKGPLSFDTRQGPLIIEADNVRNVVRVNIVHEAVGPLSSHWPQLKEAGLVPDASDLAPTMSVFDLETVFELIPREIERCHYMSRRIELERNAIYTADELDLLALYLRNRFNIGDDEYDGDQHSWYGLSMTLSYVRDERRGARLSSPSAATTEFWGKLLTSLEEKRPVGWTRFGHRLLNVDFAGQRKIEKLMKRGLREVGRRPDLFFQTGVTLGARRKMHTIAIAVGAPVSPEQFERNLISCCESAFEQGGQDEVLVLYWFVPRTSEPYDFVGVFQRRRQLVPSAARLSSHGA
ncbi:hypothetical protein [Brucella anthropi]|uniref:NERD domain-containing protein n=1 Tax=Brucella anthropi TaxID=529 RepID=A0A6L3Z264_BRUAN|nr:hypothetical protein [Brucella anthropi]KAB2765751.1 hypothetical protein F9L04_18385 [Brucella anthropi]